MKDGMTMKKIKRCKGKFKALQSLFGSIDNFFEQLSQKELFKKILVNYFGSMAL